MKKYLLSILFTVAMTAVSASAVDLFPVETIAADGHTSWGYMDENGQQVIPVKYAAATPFGEDGLATVTHENGGVAIIDEQGNEIIYTGTAPQSVGFSKDAVAFFYEDSVTYYSKTGEKLGNIQGGTGFLSDGLLAVQRKGKWGYVNAKGQLVIAPKYDDAGPFHNGWALVCANEVYMAINADGKEYLLPAGAAPVGMEVYEGDLVILDNGSRQALYSLSKEALLSDYMYQEILPFQDGYAAARCNSSWGILDKKGAEATPFQYHYLSYMGEGVYAARAEDGSAAAIDANDNLIYRTSVYVGGFDTIEHGVAWHGTMDNGIIFFSRVGGYINKLSNAEDPVILTDDVALVTIGGKRQYIRLRDGKVLYSPERVYDLEHCKITTTSYEKYLGTDKNGNEYGWDLTYPVVSGIADKKVQSKINSQIEAFFLEGPSFTAQRQPLRGTYGVSTQGRLLVVWAECVSGMGNGASIWNDNITLDLATGERYQVVQDLFVRNYVKDLEDLLPRDIPYYRFSYPRITETGISFFLNQPQDSMKGQRAPESKEYALTFAQLGDILNQNSECYKALNGSAMDSINKYKGYQDVAKNYWAYQAIRNVTEAELMHGDGTNFLPNSPITYAEASAIMVRFLNIDTTAIAPPDGAPWYYIEATAAEREGLTAELAAPVDYTAMMTRADAMQVLSNVMRKKGIPALSPEEIEKQLEKFTDHASVPHARRAAVAQCVKTGLVIGSDQKLQPLDVFTRAQFAQILSTMMQKNIIER